MFRPYRWALFAGLLVVALAGGASWLVGHFDISSALRDATTMRAWLARAGAWGPLFIIGLMVLAILVSPLPSAPIAIAAGAVYGHFWSTLYVLLGAEAGAIAAFLVARALGYAVLVSWFGDRLTTGWIGSQSALMGIVFISRLIPFISFDIVSYAAGLTVLSLWRFALATAVGIVPASFLLAHFGGEMTSGEPRRMMISVLALGFLTLVPVAIAFMRNRLKGTRTRKTTVNPDC